MFSGGSIGDSPDGLEVLDLGLFSDDFSGRFHCQRGGRGFFSVIFFGFALISGVMRAIKMMAIMKVQRIFVFFRLYSSF